MYHFTVLIAVSISLVAALVIPRDTLNPPAGWHLALLESYTIYHVRYMALECDQKHNTTYFDQCCHPLLANQTLAQARPAQCIPSSDDVDNCHGGAPPQSSQVSSSTTTELSIPTSATTPATIPATTPATTPAITPVPTPPPASTAPAPQNPAPTADSVTNTVNTGGFATFFFQNGVAGACGTVHSDSDLIAAIDADRYGNTGVTSPLCGKQVSITNTQNNQTVVVTIADACPTCRNDNSIDLSETAFQRLGTLSQGVLPIAWSFV